MHTALSHGEPPLYVQMSIVTMIYIVLRLYFLLRGRQDNPKQPANWLTVTYMVLLTLLSFGSWEYLVQAWHTYSGYAMQAYGVLFG